MNSQAVDLFINENNLFQNRFRHFFARDVRFRKRSNEESGIGIVLRKH